MFDTAQFNPDFFRAKSPEIIAIARQSSSVDEFRTSLARLAHEMMFEAFDEYDAFNTGGIMRVRDCAKVIVRMMTRRSEDKAKFSLAGAIMDVASGRPRPDLQPAFYADLHFLFQGLHGRGPGRAFTDLHLAPSKLKSREAAIERSGQLDALYGEVQARLDRSMSGMTDDAVDRRRKRRRHILQILGATETDWADWRWHIKNILRDAGEISQLVRLSDDEQEVIRYAKKHKLPFGITPYYLSLMDDEPESERDRAVRAQVIPPKSYVRKTIEAERIGMCRDFMLEADTSPINLITRRYPSICIFKPYNTCPQICIYCQRNWEIDDAMQPGAMASEDEIRAAVEWIRQHPAIHEVLITGGDPLAMGDRNIERIIGMVADIPSIERIRIGSRTPVTIPMRLNERLVDILANFRIPGRRQVSLVTHVQHPYEITPDMAEAVERLRTRGISVYNQLVYTFYVSRRFEAAYLRRLLARIGVDPYYTFNPKGKEETSAYRVPIARLMQEQKEETRLLPGLSRTDEAVFNVPGLGKSYLRASSFRDLISIYPDGSRLYEFHPWEKNITEDVKTHISQDVPILDYLLRLDAAGEDVGDYDTIWYYY
ncbi:MAG: KamA family radical SAM protein [Desulfobulbaceae bacterium]|nr:KamA family radical SAM protein [Desulfobulbaceae bacterium]